MRPPDAITDTIVERWAASANDEILGNEVFPHAHAVFGDRWQGDSQLRRVSNGPNSSILPSPGDSRSMLTNILLLGDSASAGTGNFLNTHP